MVTINASIKRKPLKIAICLGFAIFFVIISRFIEGHRDLSFGFGSLQLPASSFLGILQAMQGMMCIIMVILDYKKGRILSYLFMGISIVFMLIGIIARGEMSSLPGIYNAIITLISIVIISTGLAKADRRAVTDFLTGLKNRRGFSALLEKAIRDKKPFHVVYFEIENFRTINDNLGHKYGDVALKAVADKLKEKEDDEKVYVGRIGGAEFAAVVFVQQRVRHPFGIRLPARNEKAPLAGRFLQTGVDDVDHFIPVHHSFTSSRTFGAAHGSARMCAD